MRRWLALTLVSCSRPNPLFLEELGATEAASASSTSTGVTGDVTTGLAGSSTTGTTEPVPETSTSAGTTAVDPLCGDFSLERIGFNPLLGQTDCESVKTFYVSADVVGDAIKLTPCLGSGCTNCFPLLATTLPPDLTPLFVPGSCMTGKHEGLWVPKGDPEVSTQCKTTGLALYDNDTIYPLFAGSARVLHPPSFIDPDVAMTVERGVGERCACAPDDCCLNGQAEVFDLQFSYDGLTVGVIGEGASFQTKLKEATYIAGVVRAYAKGYASTTDGACVDDPETPYIDWLMVRVSGPP